MKPNEFPITETKLDPDFGTFVGVTEEAAGMLKENCRDRADAREAVLRMTIRELSMPEEVLQSVDEDENHLETTQPDPTATLGE